MDWKKRHIVNPNYSFETYSCFWVFSFEFFDNSGAEMNLIFEGNFIHQEQNSQLNLIDYPFNSFYKNLFGSNYEFSSCTELEMIFFFVSF